MWSLELAGWPRASAALVRRVVGVEIKASMDVNPSDFNGLRSFALNAGQRFHRGFLLYTGYEVIQYDKNLWAVPVASLWL
jgi:uncharacterized protein